MLRISALLSIAEFPKTKEQKKYSVVDSIKSEMPFYPKLIRRTMSSSLKAEQKGFSLSFSLPFFLCVSISLSFSFLCRFLEYERPVKLNQSSRLKQFNFRIQPFSDG